MALASCLAFAAANAEEPAAPAAPAPAPTVKAGMKRAVLVGTSFGLAKALGSGETQKAGGSGPGLGVFASYSVTDAWSVGAAYDYLNFKQSLRASVTSAEAVYTALPKKRWSPTATAGVGFAKVSGFPPADHDITKIAYKVGSGLRWALDDAVLFDIYLNYHFIRIAGDSNDINALGYGVTAIYRFAPSPSPSPSP